jgi:hypothetical protein
MFSSPAGTMSAALYHRGPRVGRDAQSRPLDVTTRAKRHRRPGPMLRAARESTVPQLVALSRDRRLAVGRRRHGRSRRVHGRGQELRHRLEHLVHGDAKRLGDLLDVLIAQRLADLVRRDRQVIPILVEPGLHLRDCTCAAKSAFCNLARTDCRSSSPITFFMSSGSAACSASPTRFPTAPLRVSLQLMARPFLGCLPLVLARFLCRMSRKHFSRSAIAVSAGEKRRMRTVARTLP